MGIKMALVVALMVLPAPTMDIPIHCLLPRPVMAQEGNPGHKEPPPGWTCAQDNDTDPAHQCNCHRECKDSEELGEDGIGTGKKVTRVQEDSKCKSFCWGSHCHCPLHNCD